MDFFVFLDINNTLWSNQDSDKYNIHDYRVDQSVSEESADALNYLLLGLKNANYNPILVITSGDRRDWEKCKSKLYSAGLDDIFTLVKLPINSRLGRWDRIGVMLHDAAKGKRDKILSGERKYTFIDSFFYRYYTKCHNYVSIESHANMTFNMSLNNTIFIYRGDKLSINKVNLFFAKNCMDINDKFQKQYLDVISKDRQNNGNKKVKVISYYDFLKQEYAEFKAKRKIKKEEQMAEYIDSVKGISQINRHTKFKLKKLNKKASYKSDNAVKIEYPPMVIEENYPLVPVEEQSYFDFER